MRCVLINAYCFKFKQIIVVVSFYMTILIFFSPFLTNI